MSLRNPARSERYQEDNTFTYLIVGLVLFFIIGLLIHRYTYQFYGVWKAVFLPVIKLIDVLSNSIVGWFVNPLLNITGHQAHSLYQFVNHTPVVMWHTSVFVAMNHFIGKCLLLVLLPICVYGLVSVFKQSEGFSHMFRRFKNSDSLNSYMLKKGALPTDMARDGSEFDDVQISALSCAQFCQKHKLVVIDDDNTVTDFDTESAFNVLNQQLGRRYHKRADIFDGDVAWAAKILIDSIPVSYRSEALDHALDGHLYVSTVLLSLLNTARYFGVVGIQHLLPLKQPHRALWYAVASLGRKVAFVEGSAIVAQFNYEIGLKKKSAKKTTPLLAQIDTAINGLIQALDEEAIVSLERPMLTDNLKQGLF